MPVADPSTLRYGGATTCLSVDLGDGAHLLLDCGTGMRGFEASLDESANDFTVLLSHYHWDHLMGLPFFRSLYSDSASFRFIGAPWEGHSVEEGVAGIFRPPWFPVPISETASKKEFISVPDEPFQVGPVTVTAARLNHPQGVTAFRLDHDGVGIVFATDVEHGDQGSDSALFELAAGADILIHDAQYSPDDYNAHAGWGHSTWEDAVFAAEAAGVDRLILVSHDPVRTDDEVDRLLEDCRRRFSNSDAAYAGMAVEF